LEQVVDSVRLHFPLIRAAAAGRGIASGEIWAALGEFDHKLKASSENQALGFYENYRHQTGVERNTFWGGRVFAGYRVGRGDFEPWYQERETNEGGEFNAGLVMPLAQNRWIDPNRAALWQAQIERNIVEPEIQREIILAVRDASFLYWEWLAAGETYRIVQSLLDIATERDAGLRRQVESGDLPEIVLTDNRRLIVSREAKLIEAERKLEQSAIKLSLFLRTSVGEPSIPTREQLPQRFPAIPETMGDPLSSADIEVALRTRPELAALSLLRRKTQVELQQANNLRLPELNAIVWSSQDVGEPTKDLRDKSPLILEAGVTMSAPLERRKARGKIRATEAKLTQIQIKERFASEKISTEVRGARVAMDAARRQARQMHESLELASQMEVAEQRAFELGDSNLLNVNLREQQRADAALDLVAAQLAYFLAQAEFDAAMGVPFVASQ
jgi:outer membrane protein TolC